MKTILVTGGAGFIGSHLCEALLSQGHKVICVDNFITGSKKNINHLFSNKNFSLIEQDICKPLELKEKVHEIYNLASIASPKFYYKYPIETLLVGSVGVKNMLDLALKNNAKFLHSSTSEIYGDPLQHPQTESYWGNVNPIGERSCYDESKRFAETLIMTYHRKHCLSSRIVRIFNTYGPKMSEGDGRVIPNFISQALSNKPLTVYGDGSQTRSFCYIDDLVEGLVKAMNSEYNLPINLGNPNETTILELAKKIIKLTDSKSKINFLPLPKDDPAKRKPDTSLAKKELNWQPKISLEEGLKRLSHQISST